MQDHSSLSKTSMRFALLSIVFLLSFVSKVQSKVYKDSINTVTLDTIATDSTYLITRTTFVESTSIDSAYSKDSANSKIQLKINALNPLYVNNIKKKPEGKTEIDSAIAALSKGLEVSAKMFKILFSAMDSSIMKRCLDSALTVSSGDLKTAIGKMNKYIRVNNSSSIFNGLDVVAKLAHVEMNGKKIGASELNSTFIKSVTIDDLKRTTANLTAIKEQIERLKSEHSGKVVASELSNQFVALFKDPLVVRIFENALTQAQSAATNTYIHTETKSVTTKFSYTVNRNNELNQKP